MNRLILAFLVSIVLTSCMNSYTVQGTSNVSILDGRMLYLKTYKDGELKNVDSCDVVHGQFNFTGTLDSAKMVTLFMDNESILPFVLERGDIAVKLDDAQQKVSGTPLNEKLTKFMEDYNKLSNQFNELSHKQSEAIMDGLDENETNERLTIEANEILQKEDKLITSFIEENFDNVLGPGVFFMVTAGDRFPELRPWIVDIMSKATDNFKNNSYVKDYYEKAKQNEDIMNGTVEPVQVPPTTPNVPLPQAPTPNQMAMPADSAASQK